MSKYIYSTMSADNDVVLYAENAEKKQVAKGRVTIFGKANVANKRTLITPKGVLTTLEDKEYELIKDNPHFKKWIEKGFITVETKKVDADKAAENMSKKDKSAQKTKDDYKDIKADIVEE